MATTSRIGSALLLTGGIALAGLMAYTLSIGDTHLPAPTPAASADVAEVAVFFPDRVDWRDFQLGLSECARRGLIKVDFEGDDEVLVETPERGRLVRFRWESARGRNETEQEARRLVALPRPPIAVVGSGNTALTADLAGVLGSAGVGRTPVLLVPWASSVMIQKPGESSREPLLEIDRGRTFRFCPNNRKLAGQVVRCLADTEPSSLPGRVVLVVDDHDPYSVDLADGFSRSIRALSPRSEFVTLTDPEPEAGMNDTPGATERRWAEGLWQNARDSGTSRPTWVVLPLQAEPARRLLLALRGVARSLAESEAPLRVLCGDAVGVELLSTLLGPHAVPVWAASPASVPASASGLGVAHDAQVPAEIVSALTRCLDSKPEGDLAPALQNLRIEPDDPAAFGRTLAFDPDGERSGEDLGLVLAVRPGRGEVLAYSRGPKGVWNPPVPVSPPIQVVR